MSDDDTRWADHLLERARATAAPREQDAARNLASIEARLGLGPALDAATSEATTSGTAAAREAGRSLAAGAAGRAGASSVARGLLQRGPRNGRWMRGGWAKAGGVLAFGAATGVVGYLIGRAETERRHAEVAVDAAEGSLAPPVPPVTASDAAIAPTAPAPSPAVPTEETPTKETPTATPQRSVAVARRAHPSSLAAPASKAAAAAPAREDAFELSDALELLRRAQAAVRRADGLEARMWLSDLDRRARPELLLEERLVTLTLADCVLGDVEAARTTLRELESANAESIYRARLEGSCVADRMQGGADRARGR